MLKAAQAILGVREFDAGLTANAENLERCLELLAARGTQSARGDVARSMLLRRLGRPDEAYAPARRAFETQPSWLTATEWATVERRRGRTEEAARLYREAARLDPADATALIDLGDMMLEARRPALAAAAYREALERAPDDGWARASQLFALWRAGDPNAKSALTTMASGHDDAASRARALLSIA